MFIGWFLIVTVNKFADDTDDGHRLTINLDNSVTGFHTRPIGRRVLKRGHHSQKTVADGDHDSVGVGAADDIQAGEEFLRSALGVVAGAKGGRLVVEQVRRGTPAYDAGLNAEDELIAFDDYRLDPADFKGRLEHYKPGETVTILVSRRGKLERIELTFGEEPEKKWRLRLKEDANEEQVARRVAWIGE